MTILRVAAIPAVCPPRSLMRAFVLAALVLAGCSSGRTSADKATATAAPSRSSAINSVSASSAARHADLTIVVPESPSSVRATKVYLAGSSRQIGTVVEVDQAATPHEARARIALTDKGLLHLDASALVCDTAVRINAGSSTAPVGGEGFVIPMVRTAVRPGGC